MGTELLGDAPTTPSDRRRPPRPWVYAGLALALLAAVAVAVVSLPGRGVPARPPVLGGPLLRPDRSHDVPVSWYAVHGVDARALTVGYWVGACSEPGRVEVVRQSARFVLVTASSVAPGAGTTCSGGRTEASDTVVLARALGDRDVLDARSAQHLPRQRLERRPADTL